jgi:hypothetical protein
LADRYTKTDGRQRITSAVGLRTLMPLGQAMPGKGMAVIRNFRGKWHA